MCPSRIERDPCISRIKAHLTGTRENGARWSLIHQLSIMRSLRQMTTWPALLPEKTLGLWGTALLIESAKETQPVSQGSILFSEGCDLISLLDPLQIALNVLNVLVLKTLVVGELVISILDEWCKCFNLSVCYVNVKKRVFSITADWSHEMYSLLLAGIQSVMNKLA